MGTIIEFFYENVDGCDSDVTVYVEIINNKPVDETAIRNQIAETVIKYKGQEWQYEELISIVLSNLAYQYRILVPTYRFTI